ncbi:MAG TPA: glycosyltransferase family 87 protein [Chloroflexia bacterium]|nr:glycosyltransferase family 87 protein [Chloroflexia bacterium]
MGEEAPRRAALSKPVRLALWALGFCAVLGLTWQWSAGTGVHNDFTQNVWLPSRLVLDGVNPYYPPASQVDMALGAYRAEFDAFNGGPEYYFIYPLWLALAMTPFGAMPLLVATAIWRAANVLLLLWGVAALLRKFNPAFRSNKPVALAALGMTLFLSLVYRESILTLFIGQFAIVEFGLIVAVLGWLVTSHEAQGSRRLWGDVLAGVALGVLATKPQSVGLPIVLLCIWALSRRRFAMPVSAIASFVLMLGLPALFYPNSIGDWLSVVFGRGQAASQAQVSASVWGLAYNWLGADSPWRLIALALTIAGVAAILPWWWRDLRDKTSPMPMSLPLTLCMNSVISPYMLGYEHVLLLIPALLYIAAAGLPGDSGLSGEELAGKKRLRMAMYTWMAVLPILVVALQSVRGKEYPAIAQSLPMLAICWVVRLTWTTNEGVKRET